MMATIDTLAAPLHLLSVGGAAGTHATTDERVPLVTTAHPGRSASAMDPLQGPLGGVGVIHLMGVRHTPYTYR